MLVRTDLSAHKTYFSADVHSNPMSLGRPRRGTGRGRRARGKSSRRPPVNVGDIIEVQIVELSRRGDGIARVRGFIIFVPGTKPGDQVRVKIKRIGQTYAVGERVSEEASEALEETSAGEYLEE